MKIERTTISGARGLDRDEPLSFEQGAPGRTGVDLPAAPDAPDRLGGLRRQGDIGLPGLAEPQVVRHFVRLSRMNYAIDYGLYPLGSCTMKHNPRLNERLARLPGIGDVHPMQPQSTTQGALRLMSELAHWLTELTGMATVAMTPGAGAQGEMCGMMAIRAAHEARGEPRKRVLVPESAHGTNPATAAICGYEVDSIPATADGRVDMAAFEAKLGPDVAGLMLTNPNTCGLFERDIIRIAELIHGVGGYFYCDGANFNAIVGKVRPGDLGIDAMHINLHKTFSTPHGGGGPGSGPVVFSEALAPYAPLPKVVQRDGRYELIEQEDGPRVGRMKGFHGQFGMFVRALAYMQSHGRDGLKQVAEDAVLNANYVMAKLQDLLPPAYPGPCMHEVLMSDRGLDGTGVETMDLAKALIDEGYHPMTVYFPLIVHGAMLIEPTETETRETLDGFIAVMRGLVEQARAGDELAYFKAAPVMTPRRRLDETLAARKPVLRWVPEAPVAEAAE